MNFDCSQELKDLHAEYVSQLFEQKDFVSATAGCELDAIKLCEKSRNWVGVNYHKDLQDAIETKLGHKVGEQNGTSSAGLALTIGVCAEQHAANNVLKSAFPNEDANYDVSNLIFSKAIRPKNKKIIEPCVNCSTIFI